VRRSSVRVVRGRQVAGRQAGTQAGRQAGRHAGTQAGRQTTEVLSSKRTYLLTLLFRLWRI
jgi:predicted transposase YdaD